MAIARGRMPTMTFSLWLAFFAAAWAISLSPGPGAIAVMSASLNTVRARRSTFGLILLLDQLSSSPSPRRRVATSRGRCGRQLLGVDLITRLSQWRGRRSRCLGRYHASVPRRRSSARLLLTPQSERNSVHARRLGAFPDASIRFAAVPRRGATLGFTDLFVNILYAPGRAPSRRAAATAFGARSTASSQPVRRHRSCSRPSSAQVRRLLDDLALPAFIWARSSFLRGGPRSDARVGRVGFHRGASAARATRSLRRANASRRLRSWLRWRCALMTMTPSSFMRRSARPSRRAFTSSGNDEAATSKRRWIALDTLLTFWPPAPAERTAVSSTGLVDRVGFGFTEMSASDAFGQQDEQRHAAAT